MTEATALILLVDDDDAIRAGLSPALQRAGFRVVEARNGVEALKLVDVHAPDLIALDILMPELDGREVCRRLRQAGNWTPIIMLTQISATGEKIASLEEGADDFLNKPFDSYELIARARALLRRQAVAGRPANLASVLASDSLRLERETQRVWVEGREVPLSNKAFGVLAHLMSRPNVIVSREQLLDQVWGWDDPTGMRTVDVRIAEIRRKLGEALADLIETVPGEGYRFVGAVKAG
ncbi:MAG: response regulator transcription factor [Anaerolineales bacterium]|nr:response regulator transcription factor [Anaerolineales bacterium]